MTIADKAVFGSLLANTFRDQSHGPEQPSRKLASENLDLAWDRFWHPDIEPESRIAFILSDPVTDQDIGAVACLLAPLELVERARSSTKSVGDLLSLKLADDPGALFSPRTWPARTPSKSCLVVLAVAWSFPGRGGAGLAFTEFEDDFVECCAGHHSDHVFMFALHEHLLGLVFRSAKLVWHAAPHSLRNESFGRQAKGLTFFHLRRHDKLRSVKGWIRNIFFGRDVELSNWELTASQRQLANEIFLAKGHIPSVVRSRRQAKTETLEKMARTLWSELPPDSPVIKAINSDTSLNASQKIYRLIQHYPCLRHSRSSG